MIVFFKKKLNSRSLDVDIDKKGRGGDEDSQIDKGIYWSANKKMDYFFILFYFIFYTEVLRDLETISRIDSYEKLNDVRFEGFSAEERRQQQQQQQQQQQRQQDGQLNKVQNQEKKFSSRGPTETRTRISGFKVQCVHHYTMGPYDVFRHSGIPT